jgi:basic membrane lipoprotein Med (substrate-binding protein (PBP1-ABC) superfamily)
VRFAADGAFAGDTWHQTAEEAQEQAKFEFGNAISDWIAIPPDEKDVVAFALKASR